MSEIYKQKQYELEKELEHIEMLNNIIPKYEDYVKETNDFIDILLEETKEINMLRNIIKEARELLNQEWYSVLRKETITKVKEILERANNDNNSNTNNNWNSITNNDRQ